MMCSIDACETQVYARGWCHKHYTRWRIHGDPLTNKARVRPDCKVTDCAAKAVGHGFCPKHLQRWKKHGDPLYVRPTTCSVDGCDRARASKQGWCTMHLKRWKRHGDPEYQRPTTCVIDECERLISGRGWCKMHYNRWERHGDPHITLITFGPGEGRLWSNVEQGAPDACWPWKGQTQPNGYGIVSVHGRTMRAHRYAYELAHGPIAKGIALDHLCHDPKQCEGGVECPHRRCCNPAHLSPVEPGENNTKNRCVSYNGRKTHCKRGHAFTLDNTKITAAGSRSCRRCMVMRQHQRNLERKKARS